MCTSNKTPKPFIYHTADRFGDDLRRFFAAVFEEDEEEDTEGDLGAIVGEVPGGDEFHPGGEETSEKAAQEGAKTGDGVETGV